MAENTRSSGGFRPGGLKLGIIGLDTSHAESFAAIFNDERDALHVPGARIVAGFTGGSPDFSLSFERAPRISALLRDRHGVELLASPREVAAAADAVLLTSADGRVHLQQFSEIARLRRPTFLDKPFATTSADARAIAALAERQKIPLFSSSNLRFAAQLQAALADSSPGGITGAEFHGPLRFQPTQPGFFWYGIHLVEMVYAALGVGCKSVRTAEDNGHVIVTGTWRDGRTGIVRGELAGESGFNGVIRRGRNGQLVDAGMGAPPVQGLARAIVGFFEGGPPPVSLDVTLEIVRFLEAANESRAAGGREVAL